MVNPIKRYALLICGDPDFESDINKARDVLEKKGYKIFESGLHASLTAQENIPYSSYTHLRKTIKAIPSDANDEVVVYVTAHGSYSKLDGGKIAFISDWDLDGKDSDRILKALQKLKAGKKTYVLDTCFSQNYAQRIFQPNATIIGSSNTGEYSVGNLSKKFWDADAVISDQNHNGINGDFQDRFIYAVENNPTLSNAYYRQGYDYHLEGNNIFDSKVKLFKNTQEEISYLDSLKPGQYAIVFQPHSQYAYLSNRWFEEAKHLMGQYLLLVDGTPLQQKAPMHEPRACLLSHSNLYSHLGMGVYCAPHVKDLFKKVWNTETIDPQVRVTHLLQQLDKSSKDVNAAKYRDELEEQIIASLSLLADPFTFDNDINWLELAKMITQKLPLEDPYVRMALGRILGPAIIRNNEITNDDIEKVVTELATGLVSVELQKQYLAAKVIWDIFSRVKVNTQKKLAVILRETILKDIHRGILKNEDGIVIFLGYLYTKCLTSMNAKELSLELMEMRKRLATLLVNEFTKSWGGGFIRKHCILTLSQMIGLKS